MRLGFCDTMMEEGSGTGWWIYGKEKKVKGRNEKDIGMAKEKWKLTQNKDTKNSDRNIT